MNDPLTDVQHGGSHYKGMAIQPVEFGYANNYDDCAFSTMKYVSRHRDKAGALDLNKAVHFVDLRIQLMEKHGTFVCANVIPVGVYVRENRIPDSEAQILNLLHVWAQGRSINSDKTAKLLKGFIDDLRIDIYGKDSNAPT